MSDYILLTKDNVHDQTIASFETKEDFSQMAEVMWLKYGIAQVSVWLHIISQLRDSK